MQQGVEAPGVEPGSESVPRLASTSLARDLSSMRTPPRAGSVASSPTGLSSVCVEHHPPGTPLHLRPVQLRGKKVGGTALGYFLGSEREFNIIIGTCMPPALLTR